MSLLSTDEGTETLMLLIVTLDHMGFSYPADSKLKY